MDVHQNVISKIICDQVLNSNMPDHIKQHVSKLMMKNGESYINLILHLVVNQPNPFIIKQNDFVLYKITKDWKKKELGDEDILFDKGYSFKVDNETVYLGKVKDSSGYGTFCSYDTSFNLESYGVTDDLKLKLGESQIDYIDILPINSVISSLLYSNIEKLNSR